MFLHDDESEEPPQRANLSRGWRYQPFEVAGDDDKRPILGRWGTITIGSRTAGWIWLPGSGAGRPVLGRRHALLPPARAAGGTCGSAGTATW